MSGTSPYDGAWRALVAMVLARDGWLCHWCGGRASEGDHVVPLRLGGGRLDPANVVAACRPCNARRGGVLSAGAARTSLRPGSGRIARAARAPQNCPTGRARAFLDRSSRS